MHTQPWRALLLAATILILGALPVWAGSDELGLLDRDDGSVLVGIQNDVTLPAGAEADAVFVVQGSALVEGTAQAVVAIDSDVTVTGPGASVEAIFAVGGTLTISIGASVTDVAYVDTTIVGEEQITGDLRDIETDLAGAAGWILAALAVIAFFVVIGWLLAVLFSALLLVAFGTSQARRAAANIGGDVGKTLVVGLLMLILPWVVIGLLAITVVGIPLAIGLAMLWAFAAFLGYLVVGLWMGERILARSRMAARPYGAALLGTLILILFSWFPLVTAVATWFGLGAVSLAGWRTLRGGGAPPYPPGYGGPWGQPRQAPPPPYAAPPYASPPYVPPPTQPPQSGYRPAQGGGPPAGWA